MKNNTINKKEIEKFSKIAEEWWDPQGKFKPLHKFNPIRIAYIRDNIIKTFKLKNKKKPLEKVKILDIGCGGGLLSEPMCRLGANVTGIDASQKNISIAKLHAKKSNLNIDYICTSPEKMNSKEKFDVILNMEIVEHVEDIPKFINCVVQCLIVAKKANNPFTNTTKQYLRGNKSPYANTTRQQIQGMVDARLKSRLAEATFKPQAELATATLKPRTFSNMMFGNLRSTMTQIKNKFTGPKAYKAKVVGKPGKTISVKDPNTKQVSFVNPRISMTAAERRRAGY